MWREPQFDKSQFAGRKEKAVRATRQKTPDSYQDTWDTTGLSFSDFGSMRVKTRTGQERRLPTPDWAMNDEKLREVILKYMENRLYLPSTTEDDATRRERIEAAIVYWMPRRRVLLKRICGRFTEASKAGDTAQAESLAIQAQCLDSEILMMQRGMMAQITTLLYRYYRVGWNSTQIAEELKIYPPAVRQILFRMIRVADGRKGNGSGSGRKKKQFSGAFPAHELQRLFQMIRARNSISVCADAFKCSITTIRKVLAHACAEEENENGQ
jgi:hypothetical protein